MKLSTRIIKENLSGNTERALLMLVGQQIEGQGTFAEIKASVDAAELVPETWYEITDWRSSSLIPNLAVTNIDKRGDDIVAHSLFLKAKTNSTFYPEVIDAEFPDDTVLFDFTGNAGGDSYPNDGSEMGWVYYRGWHSTGSADKPNLFNEVWGFDIRNAVVAVGAADLTEYNLNAVRHGVLKDGVAIGIGADCQTNTADWLDAADYEEGVNDDGVKYHFLLQNARTWDAETMNGIRWRTGGGFIGRTGGVPLFYVDPTASIYDMNFDASIDNNQQFVVGKYCMINNVKFNGRVGVTMLTNDEYEVYRLANPNDWQTGQQISKIDNMGVHDFFGLLASTRFQPLNDQRNSTISGVYSNKASIVWDAASVGHSPFVNYFEGSIVWIDASHADYDLAFGALRFVNCRYLAITEGVPTHDNFYTFENVGSLSRIAPPDVFNFGGFIVVDDTDVTNNNLGYLPNCKFVHDFGGAAIADINLGASPDSILRGVIELTNGLAGALDNLGVGRQPRIMLLNNTGAALTLNDGGDVAGAVRYPVGGAAPPIVIPDGAYVLLDRVNNQWFIR